MNTSIWKLRFWGFQNWYCFQELIKYKANNKQNKKGGEYSISVLNFSQGKKKNGHYAGFLLVQVPPIPSFLCNLQLQGQFWTQNWISYPNLALNSRFDEYFRSISSFKVIVSNSGSLTVRLAWASTSGTGMQLLTTRRLPNFWNLWPKTMCGRWRKQG